MHLKDQQKVLDQKQSAPCEEGPTDLGSARPPAGEVCFPGGRPTLAGLPGAHRRVAADVSGCPVLPPGPAC